MRPAELRCQLASHDPVMCDTEFPVYYDTLYASRPAVALAIQRVVYEPLARHEYTTRCHLHFQIHLYSRLGGLYLSQRLKIVGMTPKVRMERTDKRS